MGLCKQTGSSKGGGGHGAHYHTNRILVCASIASFQSEQEHSLIHTLLAGGLWTAVKAHQRGRSTSQCYPYCQQADEKGLHIVWECTEWAAARDPHLANVHALAAKVSELPPFDKWPRCLKISGLLPEIEPPVNRQVEQHDLPFIQALHVMFVWVPAARKLRDQQTPNLFPTLCLCLCHPSTAVRAARPIGEPRRAFPMARCVLWVCASRPGAPGGGGGHGAHQLLITICAARVCVLH